MPGKISGNRTGRLSQQSLARGVSSIAVLAWLAIVMAPAADAQAIHQDPMQQASIGPDLTGRLNGAQPSGPAAAALIRSVSVRGGLSSLARQARWFLSNEQDRVLAEIARLDIPRAIVWASNDTLLPVDVGVRAAELLACGLHVVDESDGWPGARPPDHDWPFREPAHFANTIDRIVRRLISAGEQPRAEQAREERR